MVALAHRDVLVDDDGLAVLRDLWPSWRPGEPPPFHIDDVEEVEKKDNNRLGMVWWTVERGKAGVAHLDKVFRASTWVDYHKDDNTYSIKARLDAPKSLKLTPLFVGKAFKIDLMTSEYRVTRAGRLHSLEAEVHTTPHLDLLQKDFFPLLGPLLRNYLVQGPGTASSSEPISLRVWGEVRDHQFLAHCQATVADYKSKPIDLPATPVSYTGSVLMPMHPVSQISGLRLGQRWRQPLVDPLRDAFASLSGLSGGVRSLNAHVLPQPEMLRRGDSEVSCLVIEYTDDENERLGRTWVEQGSNRVLQQEAILEDSRWVMKRDLPRRPSKNHRDG